jgi:hypothetical protein
LLYIVKSIFWSQVNNLILTSLKNLVISLSDLQLLVFELHLLKYELITDIFMPKPSSDIPKDFALDKSAQIIKVPFQDSNSFTDYSSEPKSSNVHYLIGIL